MSLDQAVDLVLFAFQNGQSGDIFVQKAPAATVSLVASVLKKLLNSHDSEIKIIGTRHGEKLYETLLTKEEMVRSIEMSDYYRIPADTRDLNYSAFVEDGKEFITESEEYHSHNTYQLSELELRDLLLNLYEIQGELREMGIN